MPKKITCCGGIPINPGERCPLCGTMTDKSAVSSEPTYLWSLHMDRPLSLNHYKTIVSAIELMGYEIIDDERVPKGMYIDPPPNPVVKLPMMEDRCGKCHACRYVDDTRKIMLAKRTGDHYTDSDVQWWNQILRDNPCEDKE